MNRWQFPKPVTLIDIAFGPKEVNHYLPDWDEIPDEFKRGRNKWLTTVSDMFFNGITNVQVKCKPGVERGPALQHVSSVLHSFQPKHEHKEAGCAYLLSLWFEDIHYIVPQREETHERVCPENARHDTR